MTKTELRKDLLAMRAKTPAQQKEKIDRAITERLLSLPMYQNAQVIFCYAATMSEIATDAILADVLCTRKTLCIPLCGRAGEMVAKEITSLASLRHGRFQIREPAETARTVLPEAIDLIILPALAVDENGYRLGYGGGYYDRYLQHTTATRAALCAQARLLPTLPREVHDMRCDYIITERQVLHFDKKTEVSFI